MERCIVLLLIFISAVDSSGQNLSKFQNTSVSVGQNEGDKVIVNRIEYFYRLKSLIGRYVWKGFDDPVFELPLIYYTENNCYVTNPTRKFLSHYNPPIIHNNGRIIVYKTCLLDTTFFHMEAAMNLADTLAFNYKSPFISCSSFEITMRYP